jgi:hypothetical protein
MRAWLTNLWTLQTARHGATCGADGKGGGGSGEGQGPVGEEVRGASCRFCLSFLSSLPIPPTFLLPHYPASYPIPSYLFSPPTPIQPIFLAAHFKHLTPVLTPTLAGCRREIPQDEGRARRTRRADGGPLSLCVVRARGTAPFSCTCAPRIQACACIYYIWLISFRYIHSIPFSLDLFGSHRLAGTPSTPHAVQFGDPILTARFHSCLQPAASTYDLDSMRTSLARTWARRRHTV